MELLSWWHDWLIGSFIRFSSGFFSNLKAKCKKSNDWFDLNFEVVKKVGLEGQEAWDTRLLKGLCWKGKKGSQKPANKLKELGGVWGLTGLERQVEARDMVDRAISSKGSEVQLFMLAQSPGELHMEVGTLNKWKQSHSFPFAKLEPFYS
jgi:hypothetical protein